jgi:cell division protein FtsW
VALLTGFGLMAIFASSSLKGAQQFHDEFFFFRKQAIAAFVGFGVVFALQRLPFRWIERATLPILALTIGLLALIFVPGMYTKVGGAERWLRLPFIGGQPSELAKLAMVLFLAKNLSRASSDIDSFRKGILPNLAVLGLIGFLLLFQKDLGTPVLLFATTALMLFVAGVARKFILLCGAGAVGLAAIAILIEPYRVQRILTFLDPWSSARGAGFQIIQSFLAFRNGGAFGAGLGESRQKLFFLPEAHTDFILAVIGEELGLFGVLLLCGLFLFLAVTGFRIARHQPDPYRRFLAFGVTAMIVVQAAMNMGVTMGLLPTKGIPLPFISSGNSSLLVFLCLSAVLARLGKDVWSKAQEPENAPQSLGHS